MTVSSVVTHTCPHSLAGCFAIDVIAGAAFGIQVDSLQNPHDDFVRHASGTFTRMEKLFPVYGTFFLGLDGEGLARFWSSQCG